MIRYLFALVVAFSVALFALPALAQAVPLPAAPPLSTGVIVVTLLSLLAGIVTQAQQSGKLFGQFTIPASAMIVVTIAAPFLGGALAYLQSVAFSTTALYFAAVAGVTAVLAASAPGVAVHAHFVVPDKMAAIRAARLAGATAGLAVLLVMAGCASFSSGLASFEKLVAAGQVALVPAEQLACTIDTDVDPTGATADCAKIDSTGALVGTVFTVVEDAPSIAALVAKTSVGTQTAIRTRLAAQKAAHS